MTRFTNDEMAYELDRMIRSKADWLETFSSGHKKWPEHSIEHKRLELAVLQQAEADYRRAANRRQSA